MRKSRGKPYEGYQTPYGSAPYLSLLFSSLLFSFLLFSSLLLSFQPLFRDGYSTSSLSCPNANGRILSNEERGKTRENVES